MASFNPVTISKGSFAFCRFTIATLIWLSIIFRLRWLLAVVLLIMVLSAIFKVEKAPLILFYKYTIEKIKPSENIVVNEKGIWFSHIVGSIFSALSLLLLYYTNSIFAWIFTVIFAILQTMAACGFCSALRLYNCMAGGTCCRFGKKVKKACDRNA